MLHSETTALISDCYMKSFRRQALENIFEGQDSLPSPKTEIPVWKIYWINLPCI